MNVFLPLPTHLDALIAEIKNDVEIAQRELDRDEHARIKDHEFFHQHTSTSQL